MAVTPLASFPCPPCIPRRGNSRPPSPQNKVCRGRDRAFLCSNPVTAPAFSLSALKQGRRRPFPLPHGPAPPLLCLARRFIPADFPDRHSRRIKQTLAPQWYAGIAPSPDGSVTPPAICLFPVAGCALPAIVDKIAKGRPLGPF